MGKSKKKGNDYLPSPDTLRKFANDYETETSDAAKANQGLSTLKKNAEKDHNINWWAFKQAMRIKKKSETDQGSDIRHFIHYVQAFGLADQDDMFLGNPMEGNIETDEADDAELDELEQAAMN